MGGGVSPISRTEELASSAPGSNRLSTPNDKNDSLSADKNSENISLDQTYSQDNHIPCLPEQWIVVRRKSFKEYFGDWEVFT